MKLIKTLLDSGNILESRINAGRKLPLILRREAPAEGSARWRQIPERGAAIATRALAANVARARLRFKM